MPPALGDFDLVAHDSVNQTMLRVDPAAPPPRVVTAQGFRFPETGVLTPLDVGDEAVDLAQSPAVIRPRKVVVPAPCSE
jgi:hypothetical protein